MYVCIYIDKDIYIETRNALLGEVIERSTHQEDRVASFTEEPPPPPVD